MTIPERDCEQAALFYIFLMENPTYIKDIYMLEKIIIDKKYDSEEMQKTVFSLIPTYFSSAFDKTLGYIAHVAFDDFDEEPFVNFFDEEYWKNGYTIYFEDLEKLIPPTPGYGI